MARFSEEELDDIRRNTDIVTLIESYGTKLKERPTPNEYMGCCPLHDDETPSLFANRAKGVWQCKGACGCGGDCFQWVMKAEKVSFAHAVELLKAKAVGKLAGNGTKAAFVRRLENPTLPTAEDHELLFQVAEFYHSQLKENKAAMEYLASRGLDNAEAIAKFKIGVSDRSLGRRIPSKQVKAGKEQRARLEALGVMKEATGHEALRGCITFPVLLSENKVGEIYGRRYTRAPEHQRHWYLSGPHEGIWNAEAFGASKEIILCESIIDALTFWIAGFRNVTCSYGNQGFTEELFQAFIKSGVETCWIAWDNDEKSNPLALQLADRLMAQGIKCLRIVYPGKIKDANEFALKVKDGNGTAHGSLSMLMRNAEWLMPQDIGVTKRFVPKSVDQLSSTDSSPAPQQQETPAPKEETQPATSASLLVTIPTPSTVDEPQNILLLGAKTLEASAPTEPNQTTAPVKMPTALLEAEIKDNEIIIPIGNRSYRIRGLARNTNGFDSMKVNILARKGEAFFVDTLDIYAARGRNAFIKEASRELALEEEIIKRDLGKVLLKLEELQDSFALANIETKKIEITEADKAKALELLKSDRLIERILADFDACGVVGEQTNKLFGYIAATSRKLDKPLAMMVQSSSAAGKSSLMDAVLGFIPPEEQITYSAMTGQSLFYMGAMDLKNKILAISEEEGIRQAAYALKLLQSEGQLTIASTGKDPGTGRMETQEYHVEGPVMIFLTTTAIDVDPELMNRCTLLTVNEDREQTAAIHRQQRKEETLEGLQSNRRKETLRHLHHNAQRLLKTLHVVNPFAEELRFLDNQTRFRRDHKKYLTLIRAVALLHQYQREIKTTTIEGNVCEYIEVTTQDIVLANRLADAVLGRSIDELPPQTRRLLWQLVDMAKDEMETKQLMQDEVRFTRRDLRERLGWGQTQLKIHLDRLLEMEYVMTHRTATRLVEYELIFDGRGREGQPTLPGLIDPTKCDSPPSTITSGLEHSISGQASPISGPVPPTSGARMETSGQDRANISPSSEAMQTENTNKNMEQDDMKPET
jgi:DNA primase